MPDTHTRIKKLSPLLINQLAAGEVVTRPAAVVKELLENAIDAGASHIEVCITQGGMGMIEVVDNGDGIHPDDMIMAITRHATSKVADVANLHGISTLGFRGEALAATAAVSRLTLASSHDDSGIGRQLQVAGVLADDPKLTPVVHSRGTSITVKDLYFNVPARRGNLKSIATEFGHIETIVREVALARADISLTLLHDGKTRLKLSASSNSHILAAEPLDSTQSKSYLPLARLEQALGQDLHQNAIAISVDLSSLQQQLDSIRPAQIGGWLWPITAQTKNPPKLLYVNGRLIKEPIISHQLRQLAANIAIQGLGYALYFELPTQWLNLNVHPSKQRIKISPLNNIIAHLSHQITHILTDHGANVASTTPVALNRVPAGGQTSHQNHTYPPASDSQVNSSQVNSSADYSAKHDVPQGSNRQVRSANQCYQALEANAGAKSNSSQANEPLLAPMPPEAYGKQRFSAPNKAGVTTDFVDQKPHYNHSAIDTSLLPLCLELITGATKFDELDLEPVADEEQLADLLLFYSQGQLFLIDYAIWQKRFLALFNHQPYALVDEATAATINQQLQHYGTQMSAPDLQAFSTDLQTILAEQSLKALNTDQLITAML